MHQRKEKEIGREGNREKQVEKMTYVYIHI